MITVNLGDIIIVNPELDPTKSSPKQKVGLTGGDPITDLKGLENIDPDSLEKSDPSSGPKVAQERDLSPILKDVFKNDNQEQLSTKQALGDAGKTFDVSKKWENLSNSAVSQGIVGLSQRAKELIKELLREKPRVNWKKELKKFFDSEKNKEEDILPNRRHLGRGDILWGTRKQENDTLKILVVAIDTALCPICKNGHCVISQGSAKVFLNECYHLSQMADFDEMIILYCSDDVGVNGKGGVARIKKGQKINFEGFTTTGGKSLSAPFAWCEKNKIEPSAFIFMTDGLAKFPSPSQFRINRYKNKVFWFLCSDFSQAFEKKIPPFGRYVWIPTDHGGNLT